MKGSSQGGRDGDYPELGTPQSLRTPQWKPFQPVPLKVKTTTCGQIRWLLCHCLSGERSFAVTHLVITCARNHVNLGHEPCVQIVGFDEAELEGYREQSSREGNVENWQSGHLA